MTTLISPLGRVLLPLLAPLFMFTGCLGLTGCASWGEVTMTPDDPNQPGATPYEDQLLFAHRAAALGFKGEITLIGGAGHVGPFSYNVMGTNWTAHVTIDPLAPIPVQTMTQPSSPPVSAQTR